MIVIVTRVAIARLLQKIKSDRVFDVAVDVIVCDVDVDVDDGGLMLTSVLRDIYGC